MNAHTTLRLSALLLSALLLSCASKPSNQEAAGDNILAVQARATDGSGAPMPGVRVTIQFLGPPVYEVLTPVSEGVGYTNSDGVVNFSYITHEFHHSFNLVFFKENYETVWMDNLTWSAPETGNFTAAMKWRPN